MSALVLLAGLMLAQPAPSNCSAPNATCTARKFSLTAGNSLCLNRATCTSLIKADSATQGVALASGVANSGSNTAYIFDTASAMSGSTGLMSVKNNGTAKFTVAQDGSLVTFGGITAVSNVQMANLIENPSSSPVSLLGLVTDGGSAIVAKVNNSNTLSTSGAKLFSFQNNASEKAYISKDGSLGATFTDTSGTPGSGTANTVSGLAAFAASSSASITITDSVASASCVCIATIQTNDTTAFSAKCVPGSGSFTLTPNAATTGITKVGWVLLNCP